MAARTDLFISPDYYQLDDLLTEEQKHIREAVRNYVKKEISPIIEDYAQRAEFPRQIVKQLGELGCFGPTVPVEYGGGGLNYVSYGLIAREIERVDSGYRSMMSVQSSLVMLPIYEFGTEEQRKKFLPIIAKGGVVTAIAISEPQAGSDVTAISTRAKKDGDSYVLNGRKQWCSYGVAADYIVVMARAWHVRAERD